jgi:molybdopterin-containing oxidoreductase family iron-sulfur binding subunit
MGPLAADSAIAGALAPFAFDRNREALGVDEPVFAAMVSDLVEHAGRSAVLAGEHLPAAAQALVAAINVTLGNIGTTLTPHATGRTSVSSPAELRPALADMAAGNVAVLVNLCANPAYALPPAYGFAEAAAKVRVVVSSSLVADETSTLAHIVLPAAHDLESWGDTDLHPSAATLCQPVIKPIFSARQAEDSLLTWLPSSVSAPRTAYAYMKARWQREVYPRLAPAAPFEDFWTAALHDGFVSLATAIATPAIRGEGVAAALSDVKNAETGAIDVVLLPSAQMFDGRYADCGWLQELPNPLTSVVWGNGASIAPAFAERLGIADGDMLDIAVDGRSLSAPAILAPGMADNVIAVDLGYGRTAAGAVGTGIGANALALASTAGGLSPWLYGGASATRGSGSAKLVRTQEHYSAEGRNLIVEGTAAEFGADPEFVHTIVHTDTTPSPGNWKYLTGQKWGMAIDLSACIGCGACSVACTAENNVPTVGPEQVERGREMHWIRIDRYYHGEPENPQVAHLPILCQHCDNAPCENVCPVAATTHSADGLNEMSYNRCVGTRYCANNCPYKVRRFNYFNFHENLAAPQELLHNPEVTVRSRGVMEKCTFCVQRIREGQHAAKREDRALADGDVRTACQQTCPADAIVFGDLNDPNSRVHKLVSGARTYHVLAELGTKPAITYLARIRNPYRDLVV